MDVLIPILEILGRGPWIPSSKLGRRKGPTMAEVAYHLRPGGRLAAAAWPAQLGVTWVAPYDTAAGPRQAGLAFRQPPLDWGGGATNAYLTATKRRRGAAPVPAQPGPLSQVPGAFFFIAAEMANYLGPISRCMLSASRYCRPGAVSQAPLVRC